jgi:DNA-directed RNA polymerase subunit omega
MECIVKRALTGDIYIDNYFYSNTIIRLICLFTKPFVPKHYSLRENGQKMARITIEDCMKNINNRFVLVQMSTLRTRQLLKGSQPLVEASDNREIVKSLREIAKGKVTLTEETIDNLKGGGYLDLEQNEDTP